MVGALWAGGFPIPEMCRLSSVRGCALESSPTWHRPRGACRVPGTQHFESLLQGVGGWKGRGSPCPWLWGQHQGICFQGQHKVSGS